MPRPLIIDSSVAETVLPKEWFVDHGLYESQQSKDGQYYVTADGTEIDNLGARKFTLSMLDWRHVRDMEFQVKDVRKALGWGGTLKHGGERK